MSASPRIAFLASNTEAAQQALAQMLARYGDCTPEQADVLCPLGAMASCCRPCIAMPRSASRCSA